MPNTVEQQQESIPTYSQLIHEAFIDPIRSVTVIDDEYPTFAELLSKEATSASANAGLADSQQFPENNKLMPENIERLKNIIALCHHEKKWSIDIHDGKSPEFSNEGSIPQYLGHSDLIILDYHLDGEISPDNGERARQVIKSLENSNHFNMIIVHTKGSGDNDIQQVFDEILCLFAKPDLQHFYHIPPEKNEVIEEWIDIHSENSTFTIFDKKISIQDCLKHIEFNEETSVNIGLDKHFLFGDESEITDIVKLINSESELKIQKNDLIKWIIGEQINVIKNKLEGISHKKFKWLWNENNLLNFIQTGHVFITVIRKRNIDPKIELIESLEKALTEWNAPPMHLLMAKMRHLINEKGLEQANKIIAYREAQAGWLHNLISSNKDDLSTHDIVINAHWEQLARKTKNEIRDFSIKLINTLSNNFQNNAKSTVSHFFPECIDNNKTLAFLNAFTCSQPVLEKNLTTGTILKIDNEYWVCLSPACDISPRVKNQWKNRIGENLLAFKAVKLESETTNKDANKKANSNNYIYIIEKNEPKALSFIKKEGENPYWDILYATNLGCFKQNNTLDVNFLRLEENSITPTDSTSVGLKIEKRTAVIIAELRYEYALNFLQKLGANQSRVGLGFTDIKNFMSN